MTALRNEPEFSRSIDVAHLGESGEILTVEANAGERAALARRFGLLALDRLTAELAIAALERGAVRVTGRLQADVTQACALSLEPVPAQIDERFAALFGGPAPVAGIVDIELAEEDPPEPIENGRIDIGELVAQHLALALDPYPRAPGARLSAAGTEGLGNGGTHPFKALSELTGRQKKQR